MILLNQPVDMNGVDIPIDTCCLYDECGNEHEVKEWVYNQTTKVWTFKSDDSDDHDPGKFCVPKSLNTNYSVITNFGCHYKCPYCITKQTGMHLPETDALAVSRTLRGLLTDECIKFLSFSGGGDPMHGITTDRTRAAWYAMTQEVCEEYGVFTEMHTSAETLRQYMHDDGTVRLLRGFDRVVYHCRTVDDLDRVNKAFSHHESIYGCGNGIRVVFVVTKEATINAVEEIAKAFRGCLGVDELTFRQMVDGDFTPDDTLRDYLLDGHREGRWHYTEQGDYNRYIVNDKVYDRFEDIALAYSR